MERKTLCLLTWSESPIVVVLSGSMEPAYWRGDLLFLTNFDEDIYIYDSNIDSYPHKTNGTFSNQTSDLKDFISKSKF